MVADVELAADGRTSPRCSGVAHLVDDRAQLGDALGRDARHRQLDRVLLHAVAQADECADLVERWLGDVGAALLGERDEALDRQLFERVAHRPAADVQLGGQIGFDDAVAGLQAVGADEVAQGLGDLIAERLALDERERWGWQGHADGASAGLVRW